jgi:RNA polymerase sigma-70 factor, ECF subfamily
MAISATLKSTFNTAYEAESDSIFRFCLIRVSDREQALDLTQETFVRFWASLAEGKEMTNIRAFLFTVAHRLIIDWYRKKKPSSLESLGGDDANDPIELSDGNAVAEIELAAEGRNLILAIGKLNRSHSRAVYLRFVEGLSPPEIGEILGISANAASVRINRGLAELRTLTGYDLDSDMTR